MFLFYTYGKNCSIGTNVSTNSTVKVAKSFLKTNGRLHYACQTILHKSRFQDMRRAFADTKMTGCTLLLKVFPTDRSRRSDWILFFVSLFAFQSCNGFLGLGQEFGSSPGTRRCRRSATANFSNTSTAASRETRRSNSSNAIRAATPSGSSRGSGATPRSAGSPRTTTGRSSTTSTVRRPHRRPPAKSNRQDGHHGARL